MRVGRILLLIEIASALQRSAAANLPVSKAEPGSPNFSEVLTNVAQLRSLSRADFNRGRAVSLTGTVTLVDTNRNRFVLQDSTGAVMWYSDQPVDATIAGRMVRVACPDTSTYATTFPDFPYQPSGADIQASFEAPSNWGDYHLTRMAAYLHPPNSGMYTFWIASDDSSELWLSSDANPTHIRKIASVAEGFWTDPDEWDRFPSQRSESIYLRADSSYYIEAYQEQGLQADHLSVAWEGPGIQRSVIPGTNVTPWHIGQHTALKDENQRSLTNGVLREYWTNYAVGSVIPVSPNGPCGTALTGRDATFQILGPGTQPEARVVDLSEPLPPENNFRWIQTDGIVTFVSTDANGATLELASGARRALVRIAKWDRNRLRISQNSHVQIQGVCEGAADINSDLIVGIIWVPGPENIRQLEAVNAPNETVIPPGTPADSSAGFGGYYSARGAVLFDGWLSGRRYLYLEDIGGSVRVSDADRVLKKSLEVGQRIQVGGAVSPGKTGFQLVPMTIRLLGWQTLPLPEQLGDDATYRDGQWTEVEGVVHSVRADGVLRLKTGRGFVFVWSPGMTVDDSLVDCCLRIRGVISTETRDTPLLLVGSQQFVEVEEHGPKDPFTLPSCRISGLEKGPSGTRGLHRVKVEGTVTYANESTIFVQDGSGAVHLQPDHSPSVHSGDRVEVVGFPDSSGAVRALTEPTVRVNGTGATVQPVELDLEDALARSMNGTLIQVRGNFVTKKAQGPVEILEMQSGQRAFEAVLVGENGHLPPLAPGSLLQLTGVCIADIMPVPNPKSPNWETPPMASLQILLRTAADVVVVRGPPWWTSRKLAVLISFLLVVIGGTLLWIHLLGRRYERRQLAQVEFSRQILKSQETERHRIAANLHDSLGQNLLVIKNQIRLAMQTASDGRATSERLGNISSMASQAIEEVRQIAHDLRPYQLERVGLTQTLRSTIRQVSENCPIAFASYVDDIDGLFDHDSEIHIYRIFQEALNNVVKHSEATEAAAVVRKETGSLFIIVRDNGRGFAQETANGTELPRAGFGLSGIDERARILQGKALVESNAGDGFRITIEVPLPRQA